MIKYFILVVNIINPFHLIQSRIFITNQYYNSLKIAMVSPPIGNFVLLNKDAKFTYEYNSSNLIHQPILMTPPPQGDISSKMVNSAATPNESCRQSTSTEYHKDGSKTVTTTMNCSKKTKYDKDGQVVKETDVSNPKYRAAKSDFFNDKYEQGSSSKKK
uniref:Uncharacterized protein n=1 Tax=Bornetia secundiflora TaxID=2575637 RepID=A0A4D6WLJ8_9FLOR|nr:hypothetical protein [Bornetia secundiflora]